MSLLLSAADVRVIGVLVEKSLTTPQSYPLSVNAAMLGANQKTVRHPIMNLSEGDVGAALNRLEAEKLCQRDSSGRVSKWRHRFHQQMLLKEPTMAVLVTLMLRGPQTVAELRAGAAVMNGPADGAGVSAALEDLADRAQPLVARLPRVSGQAADRYAHLLSGEPEIPADLPATRGGTSALQLLQERLELLEARVAALEANGAP